MCRAACAGDGWRPPRSLSTEHPGPVWTALHVQEPAARDLGRPAVGGSCSGGAPAALVGAPGGCFRGRWRSHGQLQGTKTTHPPACAGRAGASGRSGFTHEGPCKALDPAAAAAAALQGAGELPVGLCHPGRRAGRASVTAGAGAGSCPAAAWHAAARGHHMRLGTVHAGPGACARLKGGRGRCWAPLLRLERAWCEHRGLPASGGALPLLLPRSRIPPA